MTEAEVEETIKSRVKWFLETFDPCGPLTFVSDLTESFKDMQRIGRDAGLAEAAQFVKEERGLEGLHAALMELRATTPHQPQVEGEVSDEA